MYWLPCILHIIATQIFYFQAMGETYSAIFKIERVFEAEAKLLSHFEKLIEAEESEGRRLPDDLLTFFDKAKIQNKKGIADENFAANPINALHIIERYVNWWATIPDTLTCEDCHISPHIIEYNTIHNELEESMSEVPNKDDITSIADSIFRLWKMYKLDLAELYKGKIKESQTDSLEPNEVLLITDILESKDLYETEIVWMETLIDRLRSGYTKLDIVEQKKYYKRLARTYLMAGQPKEATMCVQSYLDEAPDDESMEKELEFYKAKEEQGVERAVTRHNEFVYNEEVDENYIRLCNGEELRSPRQLAPLKCFSRKTTIPYLRAKEEVLNFNPRIAMFHDVISDNETKMVKEIAKNKLFRSGLQNTDGSQYADRIRISQTAWIDDIDHPIINKLSRRIETLTGLRLTRRKRASDCEALQVLNYGVGGLYLPHYDYMLQSNQEPEDLLDSGERIATWLFYLTDVKYGGSTVYPKLKVGVPVTKGSAAFWYNMRKNTEVDDLTLHAACPVLVGSKWVCNKWIRANGQLNTRPCGLSVEDTVHV